MRWRLPLTVRGRAIIGVVALYGLLLQAILGFATPASALVTPDGTVLCAEHPPTAPGDGAAHVHVHPCCTVVHAGAVVLPPSAPGVLSWPSAWETRVAWRPEAEIPHTGPPRRAGSARGPPAA